MSTPGPREPRLPSPAEALLDGWPAPSRGALEWEESASAIMTRVRQTAPGSTPDDLLAPPLPEAPDEKRAALLASEASTRGTAPPRAFDARASEASTRGTAPPRAFDARASEASTGGTAPQGARGAGTPPENEARGAGTPPRTQQGGWDTPQTKTRDANTVQAQPKETSLADIARAALSASDAASKAVARDGLIAAELGRKNPLRELTPSPRAVASASVAELQGRVARVSPPTKAGPRAPMTAVAAEAGAPPIVEAAARSVHPAALSDERKRRLAPAIVGGSVLALAAAVALYVSFERHAPREASLSVAPEQRPTPVAPAPASPDRAPPAASATRVSPSALALDDLKGTSPETPKELAAMPARKSLAFHVKKETNAGAGKLVLEERDEASNAAPAPAPAVAQEDSPPAATLAERPSTGAIQGAFGAVLTSARSCLAGQETGTRAVVTFDGATGRVKSVVLDGPGAGSPAEPCVRAALMAAKLSPFAEPSYTASVTVRPL